MLKDLCFEVIQTCPNKCKFCSSNSSQDKKKIISLEMFKKTIMHFVNSGGIEEISISGGEPLLHPNLFEMIEFCKSNGIRTVLFTSGIKKAPEIPVEMIEYIKSKCEKDIKEIEKHEPWNERLKNNVKRYYDRCLESKPFGAITKQEFENAVISEHGFLGEKDQNGDYIGESDSFVETSKEDFKDSIKLEGKYCIKDDCKIETFKIKYLEEK